MSDKETVYPPVSVQPHPMRDPTDNSRTITGVSVACRRSGQDMLLTRTEYEAFLLEMRSARCSIAKLFPEEKAADKKKK